MATERFAPRICTTCQYWEPPRGIRGCCHRFPPIQLPFTNDTAGWPIVGGKDWCGEYAPVIEAKSIESELLDLSRRLDQQERVTGLLERVAAKETADAQG